jgi:flagellar hook-associated protein 1
VSSFGSLNTALSGLLAHRRALDVVGHNIANVDTAGFSRRRASLAAVGQSTVPSMWSRTRAAGGGVDLAGVTRVREEFLERQALTSHASAARLRVEANMLGRLEQTIPEPSDVGLAAQMGDFWAAWDDVANTPGRMAGRIAVLQQASTVASSLNRIATEQRALRDAAVGEATALVAEVNAMARSIAELNGAVAQAHAAGLDPHDLSDRRDLLVLQLSSIVGVTVRGGELGSVDVLVGGTSLVRGTRAESLRVAEPGPVGAPWSATGLARVELQWGIDGYPASVSSGKIAGLLATANEHVPRSVAELDAVASAMVRTVNDLHLTGQGLDPLQDTGLHFWDPDGTTAATIRLSVDVADRPSRIAAAVAGEGALDAGLAQAIAARFSDPGGPGAVYQGMVGRLAVELQAAQRRADIQVEVAARADDFRLSVSGVNLDEELATMVATQRAYEASARLLSAVDQALDTLINRTGLVGR